MASGASAGRVAAVGGERSSAGWFRTVLNRKGPAAWVDACH